MICLDRTIADVFFQKETASSELMFGRLFLFMKPMNDEKIIKGIKNRKRSSLEKAIEKYSAYVNVVVYNIIGGKMSKEDIEEAVSDVFI